MFEIVLYLKFAASIHVSLGNPNSIKIATLATKASEDPTAGIGFPLEKRRNKLFDCNRGDTVQYHGSLRSRELGQTPMLQVFLTPRQGLSFHPLKTMV